MDTLTSELQEYGVSDADIKRIIGILHSGKTARTIRNSSGEIIRDIDSIFWNDEGNAELARNGDIIERELA